MNLKLVGLVTALALGGSEVDQGQPGKKGPWAVVQVAGTGGAGTSSPTATTTTLNSNGTSCTAAGGASCTIVYASTNWLAYRNITITLRNSGANAITDVLIEWSPDGTNFEVWDSTTMAALASSAMKSILIAGNSRKFLRIEARSAAGSTAVVSITANN